MFIASEKDSGSCALVASVGGGRLVVAHVGDSRAVLCTGELSLYIYVCVCVCVCVYYTHLRRPFFLCGGLTPQQ